MAWRRCIGVAGLGRIDELATLHLASSFATC
jgi:hypothetical protein